MKQVFSVLSVACVAFFTLFLSTTNVSCKKGDTGPKGDTGVANSVYSAWKTVTYQAAVIQPGDTVGVATLKAPEITKDVLDKGMIHVYANLGTAAAPDIVQIPYQDFYLTGIYVNVDYEVGNINFVSNILANGLYRYIIVTGTIPAGGRQATVDWNNYEEVKKFYNLKD
ncbi:MULTISPECIES: hypothetical protein [Niastella]|uniref:Lipoprotein n=1 Tax=Niastella soli TaxID=2821487 RepID=A0ABS3YUY3_9BACT|nr:hypothetical protein [Niastella soli]MBO9201220.1 hypothetical protein [Niastella soli]